MVKRLHVTLQLEAVVGSSECFARRSVSAAGAAPSRAERGQLSFSAAQGSRENRMCRRFFAVARAGARFAPLNDQFAQSRSSLGTIPASSLGKLISNGMQRARANN